ncbi:hypothetical protein [Photobacterium sanguinicancri]|uniref:Uncharacterized protein n=1 Tax=Photobacterium sanguinicancri TaxID=875932 RepID=A0AAW7Y2V8_9GAMM|nr:hypothetical protein [Photobacterium sanguinicancri]KXI22519.1 hypothetical protein AS132_13045 [Photobacterium sanguinicancri]MDO6542360.1 hypothetical protein [Photobacterium sanguinicancri]
MKLPALLLSLALVPTTAMAASDTCLSNKYHQYIDASLSWYESLVTLSVQKDKNLQEVGQWFLDGRKHHFELNRQAFDWFLENDQSRLDFSQSVESWLKLSQQDVKAIAQQDDELGKFAKQAFDDRQSTPHAKNYELRSAFADLLSHPGNIEKPLNAYNEKITKIESIECK